MTKIRYRNILKTIGILISIGILVFACPAEAIKEKGQDLVADNNGIKSGEKITNSTPTVEYVDDQILIKFKTGTSDETIAEFSSRYNAESVEKLLKKHEKMNDKSKMDVFKKHGIDRIYLLKMPKTIDIKDLINTIKQDTNIEYVEPNYIIKIERTPNDPNFSKLWGLHNIGQKINLGMGAWTQGIPDADIDAPEAWDIQTGNGNVVIAVIDTGVDYNHEDLAANIWTNPNETLNGVDDDNNGYVDDIRGWDFAALYGKLRDNNPDDDNGHGTHCAGIIAAVGDNNIGIVGVNYNASIMPIKFLNSDGRGTVADAIDAITYATFMGAKILSNSWGGYGYSQILKDAISATNDSGVLLVAAAGNDFVDADIYPLYPAGYDLPNIISVAATNNKDRIAWFSNFGKESVDLGAPGFDIYSTVPKLYWDHSDPSGYMFLSGTSMATPNVAGVAGLIMAQFPSFTVENIKKRLFNSVDPINSLEGITVTGGRVNAYNSLEVDSVPPSNIDDLHVSDPSFNAITLAWAATGDDGNTGTAKTYDMRYSTSNIANEDDWNMATKATGEPRPGPSGSIETYKVTGLSNSTAYYFALKVLDNVGNPSGLSNTASGTTTIPVLIFKDDMENGVNGWNHSGMYDNWELGTPTNVGPSTAYSGSNVWATDLDGPYTRWFMNISLVSPSVDLTMVKNAHLLFQHHYDIVLFEDGGIVEISSDNGRTWAQITPIGGYPIETIIPYVWNPLGDVPAYSGYSGTGWHEAIFDISNFDGDNINIRFRLGTDLYDDAPGWYIDDFSILGEHNDLPIADAGGPYTGTEDKPLTFDGSGSYDVNSDSLTYHWDFGDGTIGTGINPTHIYASGGDYVVTLVVNDGRVDSLPSITTSQIVEVNDPPVANAGPDKIALKGGNVMFNGSGSYDDGTIISYEWNFGDGSSTGTGETTTHIYSAIGTYSAVLTVTDDKGATGNDSVLINVPYSSIDSVSDADIPVNGSVTGSFQDTLASDNVYESISEITVAIGKNKFSHLVHKWTIDVIEIMDRNLTFHVEAYHTKNREHDDFQFAYSTDDSTYIPMITVNKTIDDNKYQTYKLPSDIYGTLFIRVIDTDMTSKNYNIDTIFIDHMLIRSTP